MPRQPLPITPESMHPKYERAIWSQYGITLDQWKEMWANQAGKCAICEADLSLLGSQGASVDHSHKSHLVRGLLCRSCNTALGTVDNERGIASVPQAAYLAVNAAVEPSAGSHPIHGWPRRVQGTRAEQGMTEASEKLKNHRRSMAMSQARLAEYLGVSVTTVARWERGEVPIPVAVQLAVEMIKQKEESR